MEEHLLQFIWHRRLYDASSLSTTTAQPVDVIDPGAPNTDQGPDFLHARIRIGGEVWVGHVEIHVRSSSWFLHGHDRDPHYNSVILHVVWVEDRPARTADGFQPPCLELGHRVGEAVLSRYRDLMQAQAWVPCAARIGDTPGLIRTAWLARLMAERLDVRTQAVQSVLDRTRMDWEQTFFVLLARQLGAPTNADPMEALAERVPLRLLRKYSDRPDLAEALLFGTAGLLSGGPEHPYVRALHGEHVFLRRKYGITPLQGLQWRFSRMRPPHFPTLRIAQLAAIVGRAESFMKLLETTPSPESWLALFRAAPTHGYWRTHYHFTAESPDGSKRIGRGTAETLLLNVIVPMAFHYGRHQGLPHLKEYAVSLWQALPPEKNNVIRGWDASGWTARDTAESQALLHLHRQYCERRRCLQCAIGLHLLRPGHP